ncbi:MAG: hypothetical protein RL172_1822 [Bacteroidota bacterium]|jgi:hypothetical protein
MKLQQKILLISVAITVLLSILLAIQGNGGSGKEYGFYFGMVAFFGGLAELLIGLVCLFVPDKRIGQGLLMSGGLLVLAGFVTCSASLNVH